MALRRANGPYIWITWLPRLLVGEDSCEWAAWFRSQHESRSWRKAPDGFVQAEWQMRHTAGINECRNRWEAEGYGVLTENQNAFLLRGKSATLAGKPDLIAVRGNVGTIVDLKTGQPSSAHAVQVMLYMYAVPLALPQYRDIVLDGQVAYPDHCVTVPASAVTPQFVQNAASLIRRLGAAAPARRVPSVAECRFCSITAADCPERATGGAAPEGRTEDF